jgi:hypothetical protein
VIGFPSHKLRKPGFAPVGEASPRFEKHATAAEKRVVEASRKAAAEPYRRAGPEHGRGKYKIEVLFVAGRTSAGPNKCGIRVYLSGSQLHGGGDELVFLCVGTNEKPGCWKPLPVKGPSEAWSEHTFCPSCKRVLGRGMTSDMVVFNSTTANLAKTVEKYFRSLGSDADVVVKHELTAKPGVREARARGEQSTAWNRDAVIYTLDRIVADTADGGSLAGRLRVFLS